MKQKKIKNYLKLVILFFGISMFLWNCEKVEEPISVQDLHSGTIEFKKLIVTENYLKISHPKVHAKFKDLKNGSISSRDYSEEYNFYFDLDEIQILETDNYTQFSLLVESSATDETHFENYVLMNYQNGEELQLLFTFTKIATDDGSQIDHPQTEIKILSGESIFGSSTSRCIGGFELVDVDVSTGCTYVSCTGTNGHGQENAGDCECGATYDCTPPRIECGTATVQQWRPCSSTSDNPNNPDNPDIGGGNNNGDDQNDDDDDDDDLIINPVEETAEDRIIECMEMISFNGPNITMPESLKDSLFNTRLFGETCKNQIDAFLEDEGCAYEVKGFAIEAARACLSGDEVDYEDKIIISSSVPECVKNIIEKVQRNNVYIDLGDMPDFVKEELNLIGQVMDIFNNSDSYHINFKVENLPLNTQGQQPNATTQIVNDISATGNVYFNIILDSNYVSNATDISIARSIIHESLHAYISYIYQTELFSDLSDSLRHLLSQSGNDQNSAQHMLMAQNFIDNIASALATWDENSLINSEYYNYLSWSGGMQSTPAFNNLTALYQQNCINANVAEQINSSSAIGQKNCN